MAPCLNCGAHHGCEPKIAMVYEREKVESIRSHALSEVILYKVKENGLQVQELGVDGREPQNPDTWGYMD